SDPRRRDHRRRRCHRRTQEGRGRKEVIQVQGQGREGDRSQGTRGPGAPGQGGTGFRRRREEARQEGQKTEESRKEGRIGREGGTPPPSDNLCRLRLSGSVSHWALSRRRFPPIHPPAAPKVPVPPHRSCSMETLRYARRTSHHA